MRWESATLRDMFAVQSLAESNETYECTPPPPAPSPPPALPSPFAPLRKGYDPLPCYRARVRVRVRVRARPVKLQLGCCASSFLLRVPCRVFFFVPRLMPWGCWISKIEQTSFSSSLLGLVVQLLTTPTSRLPSRPPSRHWTPRP